MPRFRVLVREVHVQPHIVDAESAAAAIKKVADGEGELVDNGGEYSHSLDPETWTVEKV